MTWADFNNDGKMDLFLGAGRNAANNADTTASRVYWNSGTVVQAVYLVQPQVQMAVRRRI
ncbi:MAG: hypothetical protein GAK29_04275 [Acinetobacter bereziniae]|uniref:VCBS repeat-containing protein n=1 Tax=Acinetobacter bereziniae TaxID=106648 RepID=A0A833UJD2_ACIBZ|nr:MAG: hypothetical protein GAK29_04275 [Acinetobacter bereziniae]